MNIRHLLIFLVFLTLSNGLYAQSNKGFEQGFAGWRIKGRVKLDQTHAHQGHSCAQIVQGRLSMILPVAPLAIVDFNFYIKANQKGARATIFLRFYDQKHRLLLSYQNPAGDSLNYHQAGNYTESPPFSSSMEIGIEKAVNSPGVFFADDFSLSPSPTIHQPDVNLDEYMRPFWHSDTIYNETVLLYAINGQAARGKLMFQPDQVLSVKSYDLKKTYTVESDYRLNGKEMIRTVNSSMPFSADTSFAKTDLAWFNSQSKWVVVTYIHHDSWDGTTPMFKGQLLPKVMAKLKAGKPLRILAYGMSITRGMDVSGFDDVPPFMPAYVDLFARQLRKTYRYKDIKLFNAGLPGSTVDWGARYASQYVNPLKPDLVILDFGMNDFWRMKPDEFKSYIDAIIKKVRLSNPNTEFLLLANMQFDPDYILDSDPYRSFYNGNLEGYRQVLTATEKSGVVCLDMYQISGEVYRLKKAKDCLANPLHPNDFLARWYAQVLTAALVHKF